MNLAADLSLYFADFGVDATLNGVKVRGIFDLNYAESFGIVASPSPVFTLPTAANAQQGQTLVIAAATYTVAEVEPDGTGIDLLRLK